MGYEIYEKEKTMCYDNRGLNKVLVCQVADLKPGDQYRTPEGDNILVTDTCFDGIVVRTVNIRNGTVCDVNRDTKLGRDRDGRLYASRYLNPVQPDIVVDQVDPDDAKNQADKNWPL